ncbi:hypothetical protein F5Y18DRAFT_403377 [Xylariaceae sp. FL1019]|nr:hypothetical protein F5Y18DRAFT_403377 [Xylariaceae sp. FL1019]
MRTNRLTALIGIIALASSANAQGPPWGSGSQSGWGQSGSDGGSSSNPDAANGDGSSTSTFGLGINGSNAGFDISAAMRYRSIHGISAAVAFAFLFPLGSIVMRVIPGKLTWIVHGLVQLIAYILYIAAAGLGLLLVNMVRVPPQGSSLLSMAATNAHPIIGIVLLVVLFFQPVLGFIHHRQFKKLGGRTWASYAHLWIGRLGITLGIINGGLGLALTDATGSPVLTYAVVAGVMWVLWVIAAIFGEIRRSRKTPKVEDKNYARNAVASMPANHSTANSYADHPVLPIVPASALGSDDMPSPPYTPGPLYERHVAGGQSQEMRNMKEVMDRADTVSSYSSHEMGRGQV